MVDNDALSNEVTWKPRCLGLASQWLRDKVQLKSVVDKISVLIVVYSTGRAPPRAGYSSYVCSGVSKTDLWMGGQVVAAQDRESLCVNFVDEGRD
jgi:hypothetical protein